MGSVDHEGPGDRLESLNELTCRRFLELVSLGRVITNHSGCPGVFPVFYHFSDGSIFFRVSQGTTLADASEESIIGFEVDDLDPIYHAGWSVMAVGRAQQVTDPDELDRATEFPLRPWTLQREQALFRFTPFMMSGRIVRPKPCETQPNSSLAAFLDETWLRP